MSNLNVIVTIITWLIVYVKLNRVVVFPHFLCELSTTQLSEVFWYCDDWRSLLQSGCFLPGLSSLDNQNGRHLMHESVWPPANEESSTPYRSLSGNLEEGKCGVNGTKKCGVNGTKKKKKMQEAI